MGERSGKYIPPWRHSSNIASGSSGKIFHDKDEYKHSISLKIGASLMRFIKGSWGSTQKKIEEETGVKLVFPSSRDEEIIVIKGRSADSITRASDRIHSIIDEVVKSPKLDYSHFVSLPLALHPKLVEKLVNFQTSLSGLEIEKSIFIKPATFHLTVLMLKLWNKDRVAAAGETLQNVAPKVHKALGKRPVSIRLKGLECMQGSFAKARVVYIPVEEIGHGGRLKHACQIITDAFVEAGLVVDKNALRELKLHATVMNARHRARKEGTSFADSFDASSIFEQYGSEEWGEYLIPEVHLSQRHLFDRNGYFHCCSSIPFPQLRK